MRMLLAPLALVFIAGSSAPAYDFGSGVGIVDVDAGGRACLDIANTRLRTGQRLTVVTLDAPQAAVAAEVISPNARPCRGAANDRSGDAHYLLRLPRAARTRPSPLRCSRGPRHSGRRAAS